MGKDDFAKKVEEAIHRHDAKDVQFKSADQMFGQSPAEKVLKATEPVPPSNLTNQIIEDLDKKIVAQGEHIDMLEQRLAEVDRENDALALTVRRLAVHMAVCDLHGYPFFNKS
jgi:hypothetical protein